jgi:UDP-N-acetylglucosamine:LPS N-acetylglucosamine transferase
MADLLGNRDKRAAMSQAIRRFARPDAAHEVASLVRRLADEIDIV